MRAAVIVHLNDAEQLYFHALVLHLLPWGYLQHNLARDFIRVAIDGDLFSAAGSFHLVHAAGRHITQFNFQRRGRAETQETL